MAIADLPWPAEAAPHAVASVASPVPLLQAEGLSIRFDSGGWLQRLLGEASGVLAVDRVSLTIRTGEVLGLVASRLRQVHTLGPPAAAAAARPQRHAALCVRDCWRKARRSFPPARPGRVPELRYIAQSAPDCRQ